jgi:hypothetical protein
MSVDIVKSYAEELANAIKSKEYASLLEAFGETVEVKASVMGKKYEMDNKEKLAKFLGNMPSGLSVKINKILDNENGSYTAKVAMGLGFMKMPGKWIIKLNTNNKIEFLEIK